MDEQRRLFAALTERLAKQRRVKVGRVYEKAYERYKRREEAFYAVHHKRIDLEFSPPKGLMRLFRQEAYHADMTALTREESRRKKIYMQAVETTNILERNLRSGGYNEPSEHERWAVREARRLEPELAARLDRQNQLDEIKRKEIQNQLAEQRREQIKRTLSDERTRPPPTLTPRRGRGR